MAPNKFGNKRKAGGPHRPNPLMKNGNANFSTTPRQELPDVAMPELTEEVPQNTMRFADLAGDLDQVLVDTITQDLKFGHMTPVQDQTIYPLLHDRIDCLAQAKTGTGKTIAFLLPAIQTLINKEKAAGSPTRGISLLVISPTRELAMQIAKEAATLLRRLPQYRVCLAIGGTNKDKEQRAILAGCNILIATPGRLLDHLSEPETVRQFSTLNTLVLDEADRLLDMGFSNDLKKIISYLPDKTKSKRQGLLFSATIADHVEKLAHIALSPGYKFISTIPAGELNTHEHVPQSLITVPTFSDVLPATLAALRAEISSTGIANFKAIIFTPTAQQSNWYHETLSQIPGLPPVSTLHSKMTQSRRTNITQDFRVATSAILVATDVVARGMDFPNVSTVLQVGLPMDKESYIHRLGRTARAGREGRGVFIVAEPESFFPKYTLKEIKLTPSSPAVTPADRQLVQNLASRSEIQGRVYQAWLGYYKGFLKALKWTPEHLVQQANRYAIDALQAGGVPEIEKSTVGKMGLKGVNGLNIVANRPREGQGRGAPPGGAKGIGGRESTKAPKQKIEQLPSRRLRHQ